MSDFGREWLDRHAAPDPSILKSRFAADSLVRNIADALLENHLRHIVDALNQKGLHIWLNDE